MNYDRCSICKGELKEGLTELVIKVKDEVVVIKKVPAEICCLCGEAYISPDISRKIDVIMEDFYAGRLQSTPLIAGEVALT